MRIILDIKRLTEAQVDGLVKGATDVTSFIAANVGVADKSGKFTMELPTQLRGLKNVVLEGYSITGIPCDPSQNPLQPYVMVQFDELRRNEDEVYVARTDKKESRVENGIPLPISSAPYTHRNYENPATRTWFVSTQRNGIIDLRQLRVHVRGPNNEPPQFGRLILYLNTEISYDAPFRSQAPMIMEGIDTENPSGWKHSVVGQPILGGLYR